MDVSCLPQKIMFDMHLKLYAKMLSLQLLLFEAERAWAYAQDLIAQSTLPANDAHAGTLRHSVTGRFRRAMHWSTQLLSHCQTLYAAGRLPAEHLIQATVYALIMNRRFLRYRDDFEDALVQLSVARDLLDQLAERAATSRDQALATLFADEIGPEIRYCAHELGREKVYDVDTIIAEFARKLICCWYLGHPIHACLHRIPVAVPPGPTETCYSFRLYSVHTRISTRCSIKGKRAGGQ